MRRLSRCRRKTTGLSRSCLLQETNLEGMHHTRLEWGAGVVGFFHKVKGLPCCCGAEDKQSSAKRAHQPTRLVEYFHIPIRVGTCTVRTQSSPRTLYTQDSYSKEKSRESSRTQNGSRSVRQHPEPTPDSSSVRQSLECLPMITLEQGKDP